MAKEGARAPESVLAAIEDDLRRDELIWKRVRRDLRALGAPPPRRTWRLVAAAVAALALVAGSFVVGRITAPTPAPVVVVAEAPAPFTATGLESKREGLAARYGSIWGWGPAVTETTAAPGRSMRTIPAAGLDAKREGFVARYGSIWGWGPAVSAASDTTGTPGRSATIPARALEPRKS